ncbi:MAG TPA: PDZ domain-containing protein [Oceanospirillales bacterium]|nr:PDZ domain-containing protein [Oceanospirillales bacterium]
MNGKELNSEEITNLEASGQMQSFTMNTDDGKIMKKVVFINTGDDLKGSTKHESKIITKTLHLDSDNNATLGFIANIKEDGWHVISVVKNSGAEDAGLQAGDVLKMMGGIDLTNKIENIQDIIDLTHREAGEYIDLKAKRGDSLITFSVEARKNGSADIIMNNNGEQNIVMFDDANLDFSKKMSVIVTDGEGMNFDFNEDDINVVLPDDLNALKMYITQGDSTSELLGNNNKLSTLSEGLATYFNTDSGVLVLKAGANNAFALKDGDVIKSIDGEKVTTPKDVIKQLLKADKQEDIKIKIVRHKRNKTLKYNK